MYMKSVQYMVEWQKLCIIRGLLVVMVATDSVIRFVQGCWITIKTFVECRKVVPRCQDLFVMGIVVPKVKGQQVE
jgi:hypothetical protein